MILHKKEVIMNKKQILEKSTQIINKIIENTDYELVDLEYVKEGPFMYLRVYLDKEDGITIDDCAVVSKEFNKKLDELDFIDDQYFLEVSSPGVDRAFKKESDYINNLNNEVEAKLFTPVNGMKLIKGILLEKNENDIVIGLGTKGDENKVTVELKNITKINKLVELF
jgi:ribosome maturation factor RimP